MTQIKEITVGIQRVINLGNYENVRYECSVTVDVDPNKEDGNLSYDEALEFCKEKVGAEVDRIEAGMQLSRKAR